MVVFSLFLVGLFCLFFFSLSQEYQLLSRVCGRNFHYCPCSKDHQLLAAAVFKHFMCRIHNCSVAVSAVDRAQRNAWHCPSCPCCQVKLHKVIFRRLRPQCVSLMVDLGTVGCFSPAATSYLRFVFQSHLGLSSFCNWRRNTVLLLEAVSGDLFCHRV